MRRIERRLHVALGHRLFQRTKAGVVDKPAQQALYHCLIVKTAQDIVIVSVHLAVTFLNCHYFPFLQSPEKAIDTKKKTATATPSRGKLLQPNYLLLAGNESGKLLALRP